MKVRLVEILPALLLAGMLAGAGIPPQSAADPTYTMTVTPSRYASTSGRSAVTRPAARPAEPVGTDPGDAQVEPLVAVRREEEPVPRRTETAVRRCRARARAA